MVNPKITRHETRRISLKLAQEPQHNSFEDHLAVEEPLEIRVHDEPVMVAMRTPGDDLSLVAGLLYAEGLLRSSKEIGTILPVENEKNAVNVVFAGTKPDLARLRRRTAVSSSCGVSGKSTIDQIKTLAKPVPPGLKVKLEVVYGLGHSLRRAQTLFERSGGLHAAGVFDAQGVLLTLHEDVGRHNAVDKSVGHMLRQDRMPLDRHILMMSGRTSFEIVQRAVMAQMPMVCAVSAPSSLAVETAHAFGVTLVGFLREDDFNVYTHAERIEV